MLIKSLKLHNVRSYLSEEIYFPDGSLLLSGDIGSGKSTILLAIEFALFGVVRGSISGESLLRHGKNNGYVELTFILDGKEIVIRRALRRNKHSIAQAAGYIVINSLKTDCTPVELKARVLELLGYPKSLLTKSKSLIYRYTVYTPQEAMKHILFEEPDARLDTLRKVFRIDSYKVIRDNASIISRALRERTLELKAKTDGLPEKRRQMDELQSKIKSAKEGIAVVAPLLREIQLKISAQREAVKKFEEKLQSLNELKTLLAASEATLKAKQQSMEAIKLEIISALQQISIDEKAAAGSDTSSFALNLGILQHHVLRLTSEIKGKEAMQLQIESLQSLLNEIASDIVKAETTKSESRKLEANVLSSDSCPVCLQPIAESHKEHFRSKISSGLSEADSIISSKAKEREDAGKKLAAAKEKLLSFSETERKLAELSVLAGQYASDARELGIAAVPFAEMPYEIDECLNALSSSSAQLKGNSRLASVISERKKQVEQLRHRLASSLPETEELAKSLAAMKSRLQNYSSLDIEFSSAKSRLDALQQKEKELLIKNASLESEIENLNSGIEVLRREITSLDEARKLLYRSQQVRNWLEEYFINLTGVIEKSVMLRVHSEFNNYFQNWFNILMEDESISARIDDSFTPLVEINGYEVPLEHLSGGEKTSCALAYRLALNKVINDVMATIKTRDIIILDEPTDGFSSQQLEKVRDVLEQLQLPQTIIVSHESKIESFVQNVIRIVKEQHVSHVIS